MHLLEVLVRHVFADGFPCSPAGTVPAGAERLGYAEKLILHQWGQ